MTELETRTLQSLVQELHARLQELLDVTARLQAFLKSLEPPQ